MKEYCKKPIRVDYYPKTNEGIDEFEEVKIDETLESVLNHKSSAEEPMTEEELILECKHSVVENVEIIEEVMEEIQGKPLKEVVEEKNEI